jgi:hypothetical protein
MVNSDVLRTLASEKDPDLDEAARIALADEGVRKKLLEGLVSKDEVYRYNCVKVLSLISAERPEVLYPEWDYLVGLLSSANAYHRCSSLSIIADLTRVDTEGKFEDIFDQYFSLLDDPKVIVAIYLARAAGRIARFKPRLRTTVLNRLLDVDQTHHAPGRKDLLKADIIASVDEVFDDVNDKDRVLAFVEEQLECSSPKTRKAAKAFLSRHSSG